MKKVIILGILILTSASFEAQEKKGNKVVPFSNINKWSVELSTGQAKGIRPYTEGYYDFHEFGTVITNSINFGARYMFSPTYGAKLDFGYFNLKNNPKSTSKPFEQDAFTVSLQGVINTSRLFNIEKPMGKFAILLHGGIHLSKLNSQIYPKKDNNIGLMVGFSPEIKLLSKLSLMTDVTIVENLKQYNNWDGNLADRSLNQSGFMVYTSLGLSYSIGKNKSHGDWQEIIDVKLQKIDSLNNKLNELESKLKDVDNDGIPDYLDKENNTIAGAKVDSNGKSIDFNKDGIPVQFEKFIAEKINENNKISNLNLINAFINDGHISVNFEIGKNTISTTSNNNINYIKNYLVDNPTVSISIIGHADSIDINTKNNKLATSRAEAVKSKLVTLGIDASRLIINNPETETNDELNNSLKKVTFKTN
jgi:OOP family OmpA-OmpF porin